MFDPLDILPSAVDPALPRVPLTGFVIPSAEAELKPLWRTPAELAAGKRLIAQIENALEQIEAEERAAGWQYSVSLI